MADDAILAKYSAAAGDAGLRFVSAEMRSAQPTGDRRQDFLNDHEYFMRENNQDLRVRTIGGARLDIYGLYVNVLQRGGVQAVTTNRAFKMVARALNLPKSCTSAATVLRTSYMEQLYLYEQKHVFDRNASSDEVYNPHLRQGYADLGSQLDARVGVASSSGAAGTTPSSRPRRQAALAASNAVAQAVSDDPYDANRNGRRGRGGVDEASLTARQLAIVEEEVMQTRNASLPFNSSIQADRERLVAALKCPIQSEVAWALGTLNVLSYDTRTGFHARTYPGVLHALQGIIALHLDDVRRHRSYGRAVVLEREDPRGPRNTAMSLAGISVDGDPMTGSVPGSGLLDCYRRETTLRTPSLQRYESLFNLADAMALDREQCTVVAVNVIRNMSFSDPNAIHLASAKSLLELTAEVLMMFQVPLTIRVGIMDMWVNIAPYLNVSSDAAGGIVLKTCIQLLDPFLEGADHSRFTNAGEILARLAASPERNENAMVEHFPELLPRLIDMLGGRDRRYVNAGLAALCNCSAFDWPARGRIARVPRAISRLITMLSDPELAPRAALTLLNLAEAPSNRCVMLVYEKQLVSHAIQQSPAADTVASVLFDLSSWD
jgi:hypothetical protein